MYPGPAVHEKQNQAEYPRSTRFVNYVRQMLGMRKRLNWGVTLESVPSCTDPERRGICAGTVPYHIVHRGDIGTFRIFAGYAVQPVLEPYAAYTGEAFWRMQPFYTKPHPSGLNDYDALASTPYVGGVPGGA
jgi:hypothetical protein